MQSDIDCSFTNNNQNNSQRQGKAKLENKIPRSPAVVAYESYAAWRKKKFPPRTLEEYKQEDYNQPPATENSEEYFQSVKQQSNPSVKKSSYFPSEDQYSSDNYVNSNHPDTVLPRSSYFSTDSQYFISETKNDKRRSFSSSEDTREKYNPKRFQGTDQESHLAENKNNSNNIITKNSSSGNNISREAQHCLKVYSTSSKNSSPSSFSPHSEFAYNSKIGQRKMVDYNSRLNRNTNIRALEPIKHRSDDNDSIPNCCSGCNKNGESQSGEMVKGLLKLIDNQNEQIKNLQSQLNRLLTIHEDTLKEKAKCTCSLEISRQNPQICMQAYNNATGLHKTSPAIESNEMLNEPQPQQNRGNVQFDEHSKKALMERKVSIGVMTSFEFTVQNSPFNLDAENDEALIEEKRSEEEILKKSIPTNADLSKRKQNRFSLMATPLENIIEDSESHISSSQQPNSNCLSSCKSGNVQHKTATSPTIANCTNNRNNVMKSSGNSAENSFKSHNSSSNDINTENGREYTRNDFINQKHLLGREETKGSSQSEIGILNRNRNMNKNRNWMTKGDNFQEESLILSGGDVQVRERVPPSPAPSIHVDMQEYSSEEGSILTKRTPQVGWTFYNNVLGQVNNILQNSPLQDNNLPNRKDTELQEFDKNILMDTVKAATMEQLKKLGISFVDNETRDANKKVTFDTSYYSRLNPEMNMTQGTSIMTETNTSMHMKALAMKYLNEEEISDTMQQRQKRGALKNLMLTNVQGTTNMSFATMRYLQRYQLLPESMNGLIEAEGKENLHMPEISEMPEPVQQKPRINIQSQPTVAQSTKTSCPSKILDISTLKQQPKLLGYK